MSKEKRKGSAPAAVFWSEKKRKTLFAKNALKSNIKTIVLQKNLRKKAQKNNIFSIFPNFITPKKHKKHRKSLEIFFELC